MDDSKEMEKGMKENVVIEESNVSHTGYHGWAKNIPKTGQDFTPARIDTTLENKNKDGSAWNHAGTWEEKICTEWALNHLKYKILNVFDFTDQESGVRLRANSIAKCEGEAKIVYSRGKKRCGYDVSVNVEWIVHTEEDKKEVKGTLALHDFEDTNGEDYEIKIHTSGSSADHSLARDALSRWEPTFRKVLAEWKADLVEQQ